MLAKFKCLIMKKCLDLLDARAKIFVFFFIFGGRKFFFLDPPQKFVEKQGYLHTLDHHRLKNMNYFPYIFENVTFGSTKHKKYIFRKIGKIIHKKRPKI